MREILAIHVVGEFAIMLKVEIPREVSGREKNKGYSIFKGHTMVIDSDSMREAN